MGKLIIINNGNNIDLSKINITSNDILQGKIGIDNKGNIINGNIPIQGGSTIIPKTTNQTVVSSGKYINGNIIVQGDSDLISNNIRQGVNLFGVTGTCRQFKTWTGTGNSPSSTRTKFPDVGGHTFYNYVLTVAPGFTPIVFVAFYHWQPDSVTYPSWNALGNSCFVLISGENNGEILYSNLTVTAAKLTIPVPRAGDYTVHVLGY